MGKDGRKHMRCCGHVELYGRDKLTHMTHAHRRPNRSGREMGASTEHVDWRRKCGPPQDGRKLGKEFCHEQKAPAGRYYQLLPGHAATGDYLCNKICKVPSDRCWCRRNEKQSQHHYCVKMRDLEISNRRQAERRWNPSANGSIQGLLESPWFWILAEPPEQFCPSVVLKSDRW